MPVQKVRNASPAAMLAIAILGLFAAVGFVAASWVIFAAVVGAIAKKACGL